VSLRRDADSSAERANRLADEKTTLLTQTEQLLRDKSVALDETRAAQRQTRRALYVAEVNLIPFHWELGNIGEVQRLLEDQRPRGDQEDLREFVWRYWSHRLQTRQTIEPIPTPMPFAVNTVISPDGRRIAFASTTGKVHVRRWDASPDAPDELVLTVSGRFPGIGGVAFLPDGETIAIREAQQVTLWNLAQQPATRQVLTLGASMESSLGRNTFSNNGRYLTVTRGSDCEVWDLVERRPIAKATLPVQSINLRHLCVSDDGEKLITSTGTLWNLKQDRAEYSLPSQLYMERVAFSPTGEGLVTLGGPAMRLSLWDREGRERVLAEHVGVFAVSPTRREVCWATTRNVQVLRLEGAVQPRVFSYRGILALRYDPNGKDLLALDLHHLYRLPLDSVDPDAPVVLFAEQRGAEPRASDYAALSPGGTCYAASLSGEIRVWEAASGRLISKFKARRPQPANSLAIDDAVRGLAVGDNREVVTCSFLGDVEVWDGGTGQHVETLAQSGQASTSAEAINRGLGAVAASSDVQVVAAMRLDGAVVVWNRAKKHQAKLPAGTHITRPLNLSPDGKLLRTLGKAGGATAWDLHRLEAVPDVRNWDHLFLFGDRWAFPSVSQDGRIEIYDFASGERLQRLGVHARLVAIAATPDAKNIATLSGDGTLIIWDARLSAPLLTVEGTPISSDSQSLVSRHTFDPSLAQLAFVDEGHALALFQREGRVRYWRLRLPANSARPASAQAGPRMPTWTTVPGNPAM
jgi:WD40 repeat protein